MAVNLWLTDQDADIQPATGVYKRAVLGGRGDNPSLVRSVTATVAGPTSGVQVTRSSGGTALAWLTDPLDGTDLTAATWTAHLWARESDAAANAALRLVISRWTTLAASTVLDDTGSTTELTTTMADYARTTAAATVTTMADGDRLLFTLFVDDAGTLGASQTVTVSYGGTYPRAEGDSYLVCADPLRLTAATSDDAAARIRRALHQHQEHATDPVTIIEDEEVDDALRQALVKYSRDRPRIVTDYLSGDGSAYAFPLPRRWAHGFSAIKSIEHPAGEQRPTYLDEQDWVIVETSLGGQPVRALHFPELTPESGTDNIAVRYTARHVHSDEVSTVPANDTEAVCWLAASYIALSLAAKNAITNPSSAAIQGTVRDSETRWRSVSTSLVKLYDTHMGMGQSQPAAGGFVDWDVNMTGGSDHLFHRRRWR